MTKESDRFEQLYFFIESDPSKFLEASKEMLSIYKELKLQIVQFRNRIETLENDYKDEININTNLGNEIDKLQKENEALKAELIKYKDAFAKFTIEEKEESEK